MGPRLFLIACFAAFALATLAAVAAGTWLIVNALPDSGQEISQIVLVYGGGIAFILIAFIAMVWSYLDHAVAQPLTTLVRGIQTAIHANPEHRIEVDSMHQLGELPAVVRELVRHLAAARSDVDDAVAKATARVEAEKAKLSVVLQDLHEGVIVCNINHRIMLYNNRALELLHIGGSIGLDRNLFDFMNRQPILHALNRLTSDAAAGVTEIEPESSTVTFVCSTIDGRNTLEGRMSLIREREDGVSGYVLSFEDDTEELAALGLRDRLLHDATEGLRAPVANLRAAAEIFSGDEALDPQEEQAFKKVLLKESSHLADRLERLAAQYREVITGHWPMSDLYSSGIFQSIKDRLKDQHNIEIVMIGIPNWIHGDSYTLVEMLGRVIVKVGAHSGATQFEVEAVAGEKHVYLDVTWSGQPIPAYVLHGWMSEQLDPSLGGLGVKDVLDRHKTDIWSLHSGGDRACLRLPLPPGQRTAAVRSLYVRQPRPEFYDFELLNRPAHLDVLGKQPLRSLTYVVFDTETTGLEPSAGDEILSIAGVRIVNGRILTGELFERIVDPRRPIPRESIRYHGITEEMVKDKPPIQVVLPQFRAFVGDAVLVAHNAAFDLKFVTLKEAECGVRFDMPVLDTLLLSAFVHDHSPRHSLDAVAQRFGISISSRHTAAGDTLITAGVFLKMIDVLEARGIHTLDQAVEASQTIVEVRRQQMSF